MNFPGFGDAANYSKLGEACASALTSQSGSIFDNCYDPIRPLGIIAFQTGPYLLTDDPVNRAYIILAFNLLFFAGAFLALRSLIFSDKGTRSDEIPQVLLGSIVFFPLLFNLIPHVPVNLSDLPSLTFFAFAISQASHILFGKEQRGLPLGRYFLIGLLIAVSSLLKQNYFVFGFFLVFSVLLFDKGAATRSNRLKCLGAFLLGISPVLIQFMNVYLHSGTFWLYEPEVIKKYFGHAGKRPNIEAFFYTIPEQGAFMIKVADNIDYLSFIVFKLFRGLFGFEWAVYKGTLAGTRQFWTPDILDFIKAYTFVFLYGFFTLINLFRAPVSLRLLNMNAIMIALFTALTVHTELRYYIFPRVVLSVTVLYWAAYAYRHRRRTA